MWPKGGGEREEEKRKKKAVVNTATNLLIPQSMENFLTS
jgi:hypothetical protein